MRSASPPGLASIGMDPVARAAGILFAAPKYLDWHGAAGEALRREVAALASGTEQLHRLRLLTRASAGEQNEILRKMVLGMVEDIRVVLIRLASRTQTLRYFSRFDSDEKISLCKETLSILFAARESASASWQLKWEMEDLSFRFLEPELYKKIAQMLDQKRVERQRYIENQSSSSRMN
jgi:GTP pyrophosphokinase